MINKLLKEWVIQADRGEEVDLDLMVRSEEALKEPVVILTAEESLHLYNKLHGTCVIRTKIDRQIISKIIKVLG